MGRLKISHVDRTPRAAMIVFPVYSVWMDLCFLCWIFTRFLVIDVLYLEVCYCWHWLDFINKKAASSTVIEATGKKLMYCLLNKIPADIKSYLHYIVSWFTKFPVTMACLVHSYINVWTWLFIQQEPISTASISAYWERQNLWASACNTLLT